MGEVVRFRAWLSQEETAALLLSDVRSSPPNTPRKQFGLRPSTPALSVLAGALDAGFWDALLFDPIERAEPTPTNVIPFPVRA